jgi:hypothetical protein
MARHTTIKTMTGSTLRRFAPNWCSLSLPHKFANSRPFCHALVNTVRPGNHTVIAPPKYGDGGPPRKLAPDNENPGRRAIPGFVCFQMKGNYVPTGPSGCSKSPYFLAWLPMKSRTMRTMPRPSTLSRAVMNSSTCSGPQISGGSRRMTLRLYSVNATSTL